MRKILISTIFFSLSFYYIVFGQTAVSMNGKLKLVGNQLSSECGNPVYLRGMSTHGVQWFENCVNNNSFTSLKNDWKCDIVRIAMYVDEGGYKNNPSGWKTKIDAWVDQIGALGMYALIDWHILNPGNPNNSLTEAKDFWAYMSNKHKGKKHVIYEICNEPNGVAWSVVKTYAEAVIPVIRANDPETIIIVGTPQWSGKPGDVVSGGPLTGTNAYNAMYAFHFYAASHASYRSEVQKAAKSIPIFATEWGMSEASGGGSISVSEGQLWMDIFNGNNDGQQKISWCNWSFSDKAESSAALNSGACGSSNWTNTTASGTQVKTWISSPAKSFTDCGATSNKNPTVSLAAPTSGTAICAGAALTLTATASDPDGTISKVEFYNGTNLIGTVTASPYTYSWSGATSGTASITAKAYDNAATVGTATSSAVSVTVNAAPSAPTGTANYNYCVGSTATALTVSGTLLKWYTQATAGTSNTTAPTPTTTAVGAQNFWVSQTTNNCESPRLAITATVAQTATPTGTTSINYCVGSIATALTVTGTSLKWYTVATTGISSTTAPTPTTTNTGSQNYWVSQTLNNCESARLQITVTVGAATSAPTVTSSAVSYCQNSTATALSATGTSLKWYSSSTEGTGSNTAPTPITSTAGITNYYVSQTSNGCESARTNIAVTINAAPQAPSVTSLINYNVGETASVLTATGTNLKWYTMATSGTASTTAPTPSTANVSSITYYVSQTNTSGCESARASIVVSVSNNYKIYKTATAITIDGTIDASWNNSVVLPQSFTKAITGTVSNSNDISGTFKALWDNTYLYLLGQVTDDTKTNDSQSSYDDDAVEVYVDINNNKTTTYGANDVQYTFGWNDGIVIATSPTGRSTSNINYSMLNTTGGYTFEARIPWSTLQGSPAVGQLVGFDFMVNDDDDGGTRDGKLSWNSTTDNAWQDPSLFGTAILQDIAPCPLPGAAGTIGGVASVCVPTTNQTFAIASVSDATSYDWTIPNGFTISSGTNSSTIIVSASSNAVNGNIIVTPKNVCGNGTASTPFSVAVNSKPVITTEPTDKGGCVGSSSSLSVVATGTPTPTFAWTPTGSGTGGTTSTLIFASLTANDAGNYTVKATNSCGTVTSNAAKMAITLNEIPSVSLNTSLMAVCGDGTKTIELTALATSGGSSPIFTFKENGIAISPVNQSATKFTYAIPANTGTVVKALKFTVDMVSNTACLAPAPASKNVSSTVTDFNVDPQVSASIANIVETKSTICVGTRILTTASLPTNYSATWNTVGGGASVSAGQVNGIGIGQSTLTTYKVESPLKLCPSMQDTVTTKRGSQPSNPVIINSVGPCNTKYTGIGFSATNDVGSTFDWSVTGGVVASGQGSNSILVDFNSGTTNATVSVIETNAQKCASSNTSLNIVIGTCTGIEEDQLNSNNVKLYPNPFEDHFTIGLGSFYEEIRKIELCNIEGKVMDVKQGSEITSDMQLGHNIAAGQYFVRIVTSKNLIIKSLTKIK